jgi:hypothetical protein
MIAIGPLLVASMSFDRRRLYHQSREIGSLLAGKSFVLLDDSAVFDITLFQVSPKWLYLLRIELCLFMAAGPMQVRGEGSSDLLDPIGLSESSLSLWLKRGT